MGPSIACASLEGLYSTSPFFEGAQSNFSAQLSAVDGRFALEGGVTSLAINPSSTLAVVGGAAGGVRVVNLSKGTVVGALEGHEQGESIEAITFVEFALGTTAAAVGAKSAGGASASAAGGGIVCTGGTDGKICVWDLAIMKLRATLQHSVSNDALFAVRS